MFKSIDDVLEKFTQCEYIADRRLATTVYLADKLNKPLLVEGPAGVGKTELGKVLARATGTPLVRLQCYEGLDEAKALYEWDYQKQLLYIQSFKTDGKNSWKALKQDIYTEDFLLPRPILKAFIAGERVTLLIDEIDKSDEEFESFLLEALSENQVTIPEYGTVSANYQPLVVLTSNNRRSLSDAVKRRCLHVYIDYPDFHREMKIVELKVPGISRKLGEQVVKFVQSVRNMQFAGKTGLKKPPSVSETIDWAKSLLLLQVENLDREVVSATINVLLKYHSDVEQVEKRLASFLSG